MSYNYNQIPLSVKEFTDRLNQFDVCEWDMNLENPILGIRVWSGLFQGGGAVSLDIRGIESPIWQIKVDDDSDAREVREELESIIDEWNDNPVNNYKSLIQKSRQEVLDYTKRRIAEYRGKLDKYESGDWS